MSLAITFTLNFIFSKYAGSFGKISSKQKKCGFNILISVDMLVIKILRMGQSKRLTTTTLFIM